VPLAWIDGRMVAADAPGVPVLDQAFLTGMGAFETLRAAGGRLLFLDAHHTRLVDAARLFGLDVPAAEVIAGAAEDLLARQQLESARVRVTVSGTGTPHGTPFRFGGPARVVVLAFPLPAAKAAALRLATAEIRVDAAGPLAGRKCASYALHALALHAARGRGADEALLLDSRGMLCGGAVSNLFWARHGRLMTPALSCGCRNGVTRERVIAVAARLGIAVEEVVATRDALDRAEEVFVTSAVRGVRRIATLDGRPMADAGVAARIRSALKRGETRHAARREGV